MAKSVAEIRAELTAPGQLFERLPRNCRATLRDRVAAFKVPVRIWFWEEELPRNPAGKIMKRELRDQALARA